MATFKRKEGNRSEKIGKGRRWKDVAERREKGGLNLLPD